MNLSTNPVPCNVSGGGLQLHYNVDVGAAEVEFVRMPATTPST